MVKSTITDEHGDPLAGVSVIVKNTTRGVASDLDGNYSIQASSSETLEFSFLSMFTEERKIGNQSVINVIMREDMTNLQEVVVGYGQQKKIHLTSDTASRRKSILPDLWPQSIQKRYSSLLSVI